MRTVSDKTIPQGFLLLEMNTLHLNTNHYYDP